MLKTWCGGSEGAAAAIEEAEAAGESVHAFIHGVCMAREWYGRGACRRDGPFAWWSRGRRMHAQWMLRWCTRGGWKHCG
eukprot:366229-Chlamydomonas_euryale.AAC.70